MLNNNPNTSGNTAPDFSCADFDGRTYSTKSSASEFTPAEIHTAILFGLEAFGIV